MQNLDEKLKEVGFSESQMNIAKEELETTLNKLKIFVNGRNNIFSDFKGQNHNLEEYKKTISEVCDAFTETTTQLEALGGSSTTAGQALLALQSMVNSVTGVGWSFDIDKEIEKFNSLYDAMKESVSGTGLSTEGIKNVEKITISEGVEIIPYYAFEGCESLKPIIIPESVKITAIKTLLPNNINLISTLADLWM